MQDFREKNVTEKEICVMIFSTTLSKTFLIPSRTERYIIIKVHSPSCKVHVILVIF